ncbi:unnamed protein product [Cylindrotheca closterium]|uniref:JmjC domain-containing protein n=1 Tax=Cylindrotheca closterium TaxID=2856 RepID=A0AAD2CH52_9STRA|nr:unnamed protein product [Cylindrotheca closterium]
MLSSVTKSFTSGYFPDETKHGKYWKQKHLKKIKVLVLLVLSSAVLAFTHRMLTVSINRFANDKPEQLSHEKMEKLKRTKESLQEKIKAALQEGLVIKVDEEAWKRGVIKFLRSSSEMNYVMEKHEQRLAILDTAIRMNEDSGTQWMNSEFLPSLTKGRPLLESMTKILKRKPNGAIVSPRKFFKAKRHEEKFAWEDSAVSDKSSGPKMDFTKHSYKYPAKMSVQSEQLGNYPKLRPLRTLIEDWPQDDIDHPPTPFEEVLVHFDYTDPNDVVAAREFREARLPFKLINVPEVVAAGKKWTDGYLSENFNGSVVGAKPLSGKCQESINNFFPYFNGDAWDVESFGLAPSRYNDWTFDKWAEHARYADETGLNPNKPHFYWQTGVRKEERMAPEPEWSFISKDLPSFSSPTETFFVFKPEAQKGIQCRFGERGVTAATHFDAGRNMVAMISGAKRYILSPPTECSKLGIVTTREHPMYRQSMLNFGHMNLMHDLDMPEDERSWLEESGNAMSLETVLKAGEVLYIPSHWFHYISSLQKSAQCNVRSGVDFEGDSVFGGQADVSERCDPVI